MSRIDRRNMLKLMAASAAGAAGAVTGLGGPVPALASSPGPNPPQGSASAPGASAAPRVLATAPGLTYKYLDGLSDFNFRLSSTTWQQGGEAGSIFPISTAGDFLWTNFHLPQGAILVEIIVSVLLNDANQDTWNLFMVTPSAATSTNLVTSAISSQSASVQNVSLSIVPTTIDNSQNIYGLYYGLGTANSPSTHQLYGVRLGWMNNPGMTLFPDPRRIVSGDVTPFTSGTTYGPFDATKKVGGVIASGVPAGAQSVFCAVQSYSPGVLTLFPDGAADPGIANYSGTGTSGTGLNMVYMMVPLSPGGKFKIHSYITGKFYVDAWGYAFPPG